MIMLKYFTTLYIAFIGLGMVMPYPISLSFIQEAQAIDNAKQTKSRNVLVDDDYLMLRDIFPHAQEHNVIIRRAPDLGKTYFMNKANLTKIALEHNVYWPAKDKPNGIHVTRIGRNVDRQEMEELIKRRVIETKTKSYDSIDVKVRLSQQEILLPKKGTITYEIERFNYKENTRNFQGEIRILVNRNAVNSGLKFSGVANLKKKLPTLLNSMPRGSVVRERDIIYRMENINNLHDGIISVPEDLLGMETTRHVRANSNLHFRDFRLPILVKKKQKVTMILRSNTIKMSTIGVALSDGAMGDIISIRNEKSGIVIDGKIIAPETVQISVVGASQKNRTSYRNDNQQTTQVN